MGHYCQTQSFPLRKSIEQLTDKLINRLESIYLGSVKIFFCIWIFPSLNFQLRPLPISGLYFDKIKFHKLKVSPRIMRKKILAVAILAAFPLTAQQSTQENVDLGVLNQIKWQAFNNSQVMDHLFYLSEVYGPRVTSSPNHRAAAEWIVKRLESYGLQNVHLEPWGPFGNSWQYRKFYGALVEPNYAPFIGFPLAWTPSTHGAITADVIYAPLHGPEDFAKYKGKLRGKIVLMADMRALEMHTEPEAHRLTAEEIQTRTLTPDPSRAGGFGGARRPAGPTPVPTTAVSAVELRNQINKFLSDEGAAAALTPGVNGDGGTVFATWGGSQDPSAPTPPPMAAITPEHYNRLVRLLQHGDRKSVV